MVVLNNITKVYQRGKQDVRVLRNLNMQISGGEFISIMGPSGSGKTTLLNILGGLDKPSNGEVIVNSEHIHSLSSRKLANWRASNVGFIFQFYNLLPMLTAEDNVELPLLLTKLSAADRKRKVALALSLVGLETRSRHKPTQLSGGEQQRVAIARALISDPSFLVCDEPTGDLDRETADEILGLLQYLNREQGKTIVMVTHDPKAATYAQRLINIDKGNIKTSNTENIMATI